MSFKNFTNILLLILMAINLSGCLTAVVGTTAATTGFIASQDRSVGDVIDDSTIWSRITNSLLHENKKKLYFPIKVNVMEGRVLLTGTVDDKELMLKAVEIAWAQKGVREVMNELQIKDDSPKKNYFSDSWITGNVIAKLWTLPKVRMFNYTVVTHKNIVYLFGVAKTQEEVEQVNETAAKVKGVQKVVSHVRVKSSKTRLKSLHQYKD